MKLKEDAKHISELVAYLCLAGLVLIVGGFIEDVDQTPFPYVMTIIFVYAGVGMLFMQNKGIHPPLSKKIQSGAIDLIYGFKFFYWALWWPKYLNNNK
jgi:hypothetical protein